MRIRKSIDDLFTISCQILTRLSDIEQEQEGRVDHFEEEIEKLQERVAALEQELQEKDRTQNRAERAMQDGMDAIFSYAPTSMTGGGHG